MSSPRSSPAQAARRPQSSSLPPSSASRACARVGRESPTRSPFGQALPDEFRDVLRHGKAPEYGSYIDALGALGDLMQYRPDGDRGERQKGQFVPVEDHL